MAKILLVDDDPDIVESMKIVLQSEGHEIICAKNGKEGLAKANQEKPDLIILDVMMETGDEGFHVSRELKKDEELKNVPVIMLTAIKEKTGMDFRKEAGDDVWLPVEDYCDKPLDPRQLIEKVRHHLSEKEEK